MPQMKDKFYDEFLKVPSKDNFRKFLTQTCGELDEIDYKSEWIDKGSLAKIVLAMANSNGGIIIIGVRENEDGTLTPQGIDKFKDKATVNNEISRFISPSLDYEIFDFSYDTSEYSAIQGKLFQILLVHSTPERLPFISLNETKGIDKDVIYVRRGTKCEKATEKDIENILSNRIKYTYSPSTHLTLEQHLKQLKLLYNEIPSSLRTLVKKDDNISVASVITAFSTAIYGNNEYELKDNPDYPDETYTDFIKRMIEAKKMKIEKTLDLK